MILSAHAAECIEKDQGGALLSQRPFLQRLRSLLRLLLLRLRPRQLPAMR